MDLVGLSVLTLIVAVPVGVYGIAHIPGAFQPGVRRSVAYALVSGFFFTPALLVGHGIGVAPALATLIYSVVDPTNSHTGGPLWALVPMGIVAMIVFLATSPFKPARPESLAQPTGAQGSRVRREIRRLAALAGALALLIAAPLAYRYYWRTALASYGPFVISVDTDGLNLKDIALQFQCQGLPTDAGYNGMPQAVGSGIAATGIATSLPARYLAGAKPPLLCTLFVAHPELKASFDTQYRLDSVQPRTPIILHVHVPRWTTKTMVKDPLTSTPERDFFEDTGQLQALWLPAFCVTDLERIKSQYIPLFVRRRNELLHGAPPQFGADNDMATMMARGWDLTCQEMRKRRKSGS